MLENMRKQGASLFIWVVFGILIAMFVVSFGPQSVGSTQGCTSSGKSTALVVGDTTVDDAGFRFAYNMARPVEGSTIREGLALEALIRREILAQEADRRGLRVADDLIDYSISHGEVHYAGQRVDAKGAFYDDDGNGVFDYKMFKNWLRGRLGVTVAMFKRQQRREVLASTMARILMGSVVASREDALSRFVDENTKVMFDVLTYEPSRYGNALILTDGDLDRFIAGHDAEVTAAYQEALWKGKSQVRVRRVFVAATAAIGDAAAPTAAADPARAKLVAVRADVLAGKKQLADVATALDAEPGFRAKGGDWGWYDLATPTLPDPALNQAIKTLAADAKVSEVIDTEAGFYLLAVVDKREGDLTLAQVKRELAEKVARAVWGAEAARRAAAEALAKATADKKNLRDLFKPASDAEKTGARWSYSQDLPTAWMQADGGAAAAPTAAAPIAAAPTAAAPVAAPIVPSGDVLPKLGEVPTPVVDSFGPFSRYGTRTPVGDSPEIARALFDELTTGELAKQVYEVKMGAVDAASSYAVLQVTSKQLADTKEFDKNVALHITNLTTELGAEYLNDWLRTRCFALAAKGQIKPATNLITPLDDEGRRMKIVYQPCESMSGL